MEFSDETKIRAIKASLTPRQVETVTAAQRFGQNGILICELADRQGIDRGGVSAIVALLEARGFGYRVKDTQDRRFVYFHLTETGKSI